MTPDKIIHEVMTDAQAFLLSNVGNLHIGDSKGICEVYVRKSIRLLNRAHVTAFDISTIVVRGKKYQRRGIGSSVIEQLHNSHGRDITYIENVINDDLYAHLIRRGWLVFGNVDERCFYQRRI